MKERTVISPSEAQKSTPTTIIERVRLMFSNPQITDVMRKTLDEKDFDQISSSLQQLDQNPNLAFEQKVALLQLSTWREDPNLEGNVAQKLQMDQRTVHAYIDKVASDPYLVNAYNQLTDPEEPIVDLPDKPTPKIPPSQIVNELGATKHTARHYRGFFVRARKAERLVSGHKTPSPEIMQIDLFVEKELRLAVQEGRRISNKELAEMTSRELGREINISRIKNSVSAVYATHEDIPKRRSRNRTWSTAKQKSEEKLKQIGIAISRGPVNIRELAKNLSLSTNYVRSKIRKITGSGKTKKTEISKSEI